MVLMWACCVVPFESTVDLEREGGREGGRGGKGRADRGGGKRKGKRFYCIVYVCIHTCRCIRK